MGSRARTQRTTVLAFAITSMVSCGGDLVRLGDGPAAGAAGMSTGSAGIGSAGTAGMAGTAGSGGSGAGTGGQTCLRGQVAADELVFIGDTWVEYPGTLLSRFEEHAIDAGTLSAGEHFEELAAAAVGLSAIVDQYEARQEESPKIKVLVMDGGTWDTLNAGGSQESVDRVVTVFEQFLEQVAGDGTVEHLLYFLMPPLPSIEGVDALRNPLRDLCDGSLVPCHFLDLAPVWEGHPEYIDVSGIQASESGGRAIADELWRIMEDNCIAQ
jgi:hypothetical protein